MRICCHTNKGPIQYYHLQIIFYHTRKKNPRDIFRFRPFERQSHETSHCGKEYNKKYIYFYIELYHIYN